ncbi:MAG TPA: QueT transporter family protein [bacterium (Candidatus Stahlbacteria)]|nr:QueT transporter family protein [Candidatus Stahlbacteria bacterium]
MIEVVRIWNSTRGVVLIVLTAVVYVAILLPFKVVLPIIPGFTELRPGAVIPILASISFGPAAAWGAGIGNLIGDILGGTLGLGSIFGLFGNFLYGLLPYRIYRYQKNLLFFVLGVVGSSLACGIFIGWGVDMLGLVPFTILASIITINNTIVGFVLGIPLLPFTLKRLKSINLTIKTGEGSNSIPLLILLFLVLISGLILGNLISVGIIRVRIGIGLLPHIILLVIISLLI